MKEPPDSVVSHYTTAALTSVAGIVGALAVRAAAVGGECGRGRGGRARLGYCRDGGYCRIERGVLIG